MITARRARFIYFRAKLSGGGANDFCTDTFSTSYTNRFTIFLGKNCFLTYNRDVWMISHGFLNIFFYLSSRSRFRISSLCVSFIQTIQSIQIQQIFLVFIKSKLHFLIVFLFILSWRICNNSSFTINSTSNSLQSSALNRSLVISVCSIDFIFNSFEIRFIGIFSFLFVC